MGFDQRKKEAGYVEVQERPRRPHIAPPPKPDHNEYRRKLYASDPGYAERQRERGAGGVLHRITHRVAHDAGLVPFRAFAGVGDEIARLSYPNPIHPAIDWDFTLAEEEDFDLGLFVRNVIASPTRQKFLRSKWA